MIRLLAAAEAGAAADIWLAANLDAHGLIPADYRRGSCSAVRRGTDWNTGGAEPALVRRRV